MLAGTRRGTRRPAGSISGTTFRPGANYEFVVTNTGNVTITGPFSITDNRATVTCTQPPDGALSPQEAMAAMVRPPVRDSVTHEAVTPGTVRDELVSFVDHVRRRDRADVAEPCD